MSSSSPLSKIIDPEELKATLEDRVGVLDSNIEELADRLELLRKERSILKDKIGVIVRYQNVVTQHS